MKVVIFVAIFAVAVSQPHPRCSSPKQWEGIAVVLDPGRGDFSETYISYDDTNQRLRLLVNFTSYNSSTPTVEHFEEIFNYDKKIMYLVDLDKKTCRESPLTGPFQPIEVPDNATFIAEEWIGVEGLTGAGLEAELWAGTTQHGRYAGLWAQDGCIPIMDSYNLTSLEYYSHVTMYNVTLGIRDPGVFTPPSYCK